MDRFKNVAIYKKTLGHSLECYYFENYDSAAFIDFEKWFAATTPNKIPKMETPPLAVNGGPPPAPIEVIQPVEIPPTHFPPYPPNFLPTGMGYPAVFPPTNISVPPPTVNTMNHIVSAMRHLGAAGSIRSNPPPPTSIHPFQPYGYQPNTTYFPLPNAAPPATVQRPYYPPQL